MSQVDNLCKRLQDAEKDRDLYRDRFEQLEATVNHLNESLEAKDQELDELRLRFANNNLSNSGDNHQQLSATEYEALKRAITELIAQNEDKDTKIDELRKAVATYQKVEEIILSSQSPRRRKSGDTDTMHSTSLNGGHNVRLYSFNSVNEDKSKIELAPPPIPRRGVTVQRSNSYDAFKFHRLTSSDDETETCESLTTSAIVESTAGSETPAEAADTAEDTNADNPRIKGSCTSLPRDYTNRVDMTSISKPLKERNTEEAEGEEIVPRGTKKKRGLKRFFARIRRSTSQEVVMGSRADDNPFKRGGVRSTAGPRLGGGSHAKKSRYQPAKSDSFLTPFKAWSADQVLTWLHDIGLSMYINDCRKWCKGGQHLLDASSNEVNKELKIHNSLHKKKLHLAIQAIKSGNTKEQLLMGNLRTDWVTKWLDDIGLPQYKDQFYEARVDGRMLNHLTVEDLLYMKINNALHHMSIRRGIEVLRTNNFNLGTLRRRPSLERSTQFSSSTMNGSALKTDSRERDVSLWTNHRVMEWLRMIDLSEYAVNLRGSGVHGALMILESRFTVEHLANILIIPTSKTLLRRHLSGHFVNLVGQKIQALKRDAEQKPTMALTLNMKVKVKKPNIFRRGRPMSEYICPIEKVELIELSPTSEELRVQHAVALYKKEIGKRDSSSKRDNKSKSTST